MLFLRGRFYGGLASLSRHLGGLCLFICDRCITFEKRCLDRIPFGM